MHCLSVRDRSADLSRPGASCSSGRWAAAGWAAAGWAAVELPAWTLDLTDSPRAVTSLAQGIWLTAADRVEVSFAGRGGCLFPLCCSTSLLMSPPQPLSSPSSRSIQLTEARLPGCFILQFPAFRDNRGVFVKTIQHSLFAAHGLDAEFREMFYTVSERDVLRGMHVQLPPHDHAKVVYCTSGAICDVALDLRVGSPTFGEHDVYELSGLARNGLYLPRGVAHGFFVREGPAVMMYHVTSEHDSAHDVGVLWNSFGAPWPSANPIVSLRDGGFEPLAHFRSPFRYVAPPTEVRFGGPAEDRVAAESRGVRR